MPLQKIFSIRDRASDSFGRPTLIASVGQAIRSFQDVINGNQADNEIAKHPEDFDLYHLGEFDDETGVFHCLSSPKQIAIGKDLKTSPKE